MTELLLVVALLIVVVERFYAERSHVVERRRLVNQLCARNVSELVAMENLEPAARRVRRDKPTTEPVPEQIGL